MHYTPDYSIKLPDGEINLLFNTRMFRKYTQLKGIEFEDLVDLVKEGKAFKANDLPDLFRIAAESYSATNGQQPKTYSEDEVYSWLDAMGGFNSPERLTIYKVFVSKLLNISQEAFEVLWNKVTEEVTEDAGKKQTEPA